MQQGGKKTLLYIGITIIGLLLSILLVGGLYNTSPKNGAKTVQASFAHATPANPEAMNHTACADRRQGGSSLKQACIVVIKLIVVIVLIVAIGVTITIFIIESFHNVDGYRTCYDNLVLSRDEQYYYAHLRINAATIGYGCEGDHSLSQVVHKLAAIAKDPYNKGLFIVLYSEKILYSEKASPDDLVIGHCLTLVSAIEAYKRQTQRNVIAYAETFMPKHYLVATGADKIYVAPKGILTIPAPVVLQLYALQNVHEQPLNNKAQCHVAKEGNEFAAGAYKLNPCKNDQQDNFKKCYQDPYIQRVRKRKASIQAENNWWQNLYNSGVENCVKAQLLWNSIDNLGCMNINSQQAYRMGLVDNYCKEKQKIIAELDYPVQKCGVYFPPLSLEEKWASIQQPAIEVVFIEGSIDPQLAKRIAPLLTLLAKAEQVKGLILVIDSLGGFRDNSKAISSMLKTLKGAGKVVYAYTEGYCCSAAYWIGCTAHKMFARETAGIGSIGTKIEVGHDLSRRQEKECEGDLQVFMQEFIDHVASCRAESLHASKEGLAKMVLDTEARIFDGQRAKDLQLIDGIGTLDTTIAAMKSTLRCPDIKVFYREHRTRSHYN